MWVNGKILPNKNMEKFKYFFEEIVDEENEFVEGNFSEEFR